MLGTMNIKFTFLYSHFSINFVADSTEGFSWYHTFYAVTNSQVPIQGMLLCSFVVNVLTSFSDTIDRCNLSHLHISVFCVFYVRLIQVTRSQWQRPRL